MDNPTDKRKKRELMTEYEKLITALVKDGRDIAKLEVEDSERAAVRVKSSLRALKAQIDVFYGKIEKIRVEIVSR
jgi:hypothetical protein